MRSPVIQRCISLPMQGVPEEWQPHFVYMGSSRRASSKPAKHSADQTPGTPPIASTSSARLSKHASHMRTPNGLLHPHRPGQLMSAAACMTDQAAHRTSQCCRLYVHQYAHRAVMFEQAYQKTLRVFSL